MDCNSYSYMNGKSRSTEISNHETETGNIIYISKECDFFGDHYYYVFDIMDEIEPKTFEFSTLDETGESERMAYSAAAKYYNSFMTEKNAIPMF